MTTTDDAQQRLEAGVFVQLFSLDITPLGGGILFWTPSRPQEGSPILWRGNAYTSVDVTADGFDKSTSGTLPRPRVTISNVGNLVGALLTQYGDIKGCIVTRTQTLYECLDDQPGADPDAVWPIDIFRVERKVKQNKREVVLELAAATDNAGARLPGRMVLRDSCSFIYRRWTGSAFDYTHATCPYAGSASFDSRGRACPQSSDACGKRLTDCKLRFGSGQIPFGGFPGVARVRV